MDEQNNFLRSVLIKGNADAKLFLTKSIVSHDFVFILDLFVSLLVNIRLNDS